MPGDNKWRRASNLPSVPATGSTSHRHLDHGNWHSGQTTLQSGTFAADPNYGTFYTNFNVSTVTAIIDSGSVGFYIVDSSITVCSDASSWYCPSSTLNLTAVQLDTNQSKQETISFRSPMLISFFSRMWPLTTWQVPCLLGSQQSCRSFGGCLSSLAARCLSGGRIPALALVL